MVFITNALGERLGLPEWVMDVVRAKPITARSFMEQRAAVNWSLFGMSDFCSFQRYLEFVPPINNFSVADKDELVLVDRSLKFVPALQRANISVKVDSESFSIEKLDPDRMIYWAQMKSLPMPLYRPVKVPKGMKGTSAIAGVQALFQSVISGCECQVFPGTTWAGDGISPALMRTCWNGKRVFGFEWGGGKAPKRAQHVFEAI